MSDSLLGGLAQQFSGDTIGQIAGLLGASNEETGKAVAALSLIHISEPTRPY